MLFSFFPPIHSHSATVPIIICHRRNRYLTRTEQGWIQSSSLADSSDGPEDDPEPSSSPLLKGSIRRIVQDLHQPVAILNNHLVPGGKSGGSVFKTPPCVHPPEVGELLDACPGIRIPRGLVIEFQKFLAMHFIGQGDIRSREDTPVTFDCELISPYGAIVHHNLNRF